MAGRQLVPGVRDQPPSIAFLLNQLCFSSKLTGAP